MIDETIVRRLKNGEERAFRQIYDTHFPKLYRYALAITHSPEASEEVVQEAFMTLWRKRASVDPTQSLNHYLYTLTKHQCFRSLQDVARRKDLEQELSYRLATSSTDTEDQVAFNQSYAIAQEAIRQLPPKRQLIYEMARLKGYSLREIAQELGISVSTVKNQLLLATQAVRLYFRSHSDRIIGWALLLSVLFPFA